MYCNLLQSTHFSNTSVTAIDNNNVVGFISGYIIPDKPTTLFIWQVAVHETSRGQGLAGSMLKNILDRQSCHHVNYIETTITQSNEASWALFESLARQLDTEIKKSSMFDRNKHFDNQHETELLAQLGPFNLSQPMQANNELIFTKENS
jgi:L-2,4-diaminobutyric acid acetyltransferase